MGKKNWEITLTADRKRKELSIRRLTMRLLQSVYLSGCRTGSFEIRIKI